MPFSFHRLPCSKWDLPQIRMEAYNHIVAIASACQKKLTEPQIVSLMEQYEKLGDVHIVHVVERWAVRPTYSLDKLDDMLKGTASLVWQDPKDAPKVQAPLPQSIAYVQRTVSDEKIASKEEMRLAFEELMRKDRE